MNQVALSLDIGGTWLKGAVYSYDELQRVSLCRQLPQPLKEVKVKSNLHDTEMEDSFLASLKTLTGLLVSTDMQLSSIGISTAGVVNYAGTQMKYTASHLSALKDSYWIEWMKKEFGIPVILVNDANATMIGAAALGYLKGFKTIGVMPVGTGLGFSVWRNGRLWTPYFSYTLLGCISTSTGSYDQWASVVGLANKYPGIDLLNLFSQDRYKKDVDNYLEGLRLIIQSAYYIYHTEEILIGGGLADLVVVANYPLEERLNVRLAMSPLVDGTIQKVRLLQEGNKLPLLGAALLGKGEAITQSKKCVKSYRDFSTEKAYDNSLRLEKMDPGSLIRLLWKTEEEAGLALERSLKDLLEVVENMVQRLSGGGRLIYVGAGTSGRLAAIDTVEIACTFGFPRDKVLTFISGGVADASIDIETGFEEDASSIPEMLMASVCKEDVVVGISVSGSAYYVQSALAYAKQEGAYSVIIQEEDVDGLLFCDKVVALRTGYEVIAGSTRMKAGTATKKVLNFLSTTTMILLGRVHGCYMTELECVNKKLVSRALSILKALCDLSDEEALRLLEKFDFSLNKVLNAKSL